VGCLFIESCSFRSMIVHFNSADHVFLFRVNIFDKVSFFLLQYTLVESIYSLHVRFSILLKNIIHI